MLGQAVVAQVDGGCTQHRHLSYVLKPLFMSKIPYIVHFNSRTFPRERRAGFRGNARRLRSRPAKALPHSKQMPPRAQYARDTSSAHAAAAGIKRGSRQPMGLVAFPDDFN